MVKRKPQHVQYPVELAIDSGNGVTKVVSERGKPIIFPSVIQQVEDVRLDGKGSQGFTIHVDPMRAELGREGAEVVGDW